MAEKWKRKKETYFPNNCLSFTVKITPQVQYFHVDLVLWYYFKMAVKNYFLDGPNFPPILCNEDVPKHIVQTVYCSKLTLNKFTVNTFPEKLNYSGSEGNFLFL
jgi:hypothetical protein